MDPTSISLNPWPLESLNPLGAPTIKLKSSPLPAEASAHAGEGEGFSPIPRVGQ